MIKHHIILESRREYLINVNARLLMYPFCTMYQKNPKGNITMITVFKQYLLRVIRDHEGSTSLNQYNQTEGQVKTKIKCFLLV